MTFEVSLVCSGEQSQASRAQLLGGACQALGVSQIVVCVRRISSDLTKPLGNIYLRANYEISNPPGISFYFRTLALNCADKFFG